MKRRELPELHDYSEDVQELMSRIPSKTVRWGLGVIGGLLVAFLVASCFMLPQVPVGGVADGACV